MAIRFLSVLVQKINQVRAEMVAGANTKTRVADLLQDTVDSGIFPFDPNKPDGYKQDQYVIFEGVISQAKVQTAMGESPISAVDKWEPFVISDLSQAIVNNTLPVSGKVISQINDKINQGINGVVPNADTVTFGKVKRATNEAVELGTDQETYVNPFQLKTVRNLFFQALQSLTVQTLDIAVTGGDTTNKRPFFSGGIKSILPAKPNNVQAQTVVLGSDNILYAGTTDVIVEPPTQLNFSGGVHYEAVPVSNQVVNPTLANPVPDWLITTRGVSEKVLPDNEFLYDPTVNNTLQSLYYDGGTNTVSPLPEWLKLVKGSPSKLVATITNSIVDTAFIVRVILSNPGGAGDNDDFLLTLRVSDTGNVCSNYFQLTIDQLRAMPIVRLSKYYNPAVSMGAGVSYTLRGYASKAELLANIVASGGLSRTDFSRATSSAMNVSDTLYGDSRLEHITNNTNEYWPIEAGFWGTNVVAPSVGVDGSVTVLQTNACGVITSREVVVLPKLTEAPNTIQYVQYRFVVNGLDRGDLLEVQMMDTYPDEPMGLDITLDGQPAPIAADGMNIYRRAGAMNNSALRSGALASGQNLKNKHFKVYISTTGGAPFLKVLDIITTGVSTNGFVNIG